MARSIRMAFALVPLFLVLPAHLQLGAPLGRCGPRPADPNWPQNQLPGSTSPAPQQRKTPADTVRLQREADELAELSASIPAAVGRANHGVLSKELLDKLKRVEKLSKALRNDLTR